MYRGNDRIQITDDPAVAKIYLGQGKWAIVDTDQLDQLYKYSWRAVKSQHNWYAKATIGRRPARFDLSMHRLIARTPKSKVCHHKNLNSLDNRRTNLDNQTPVDHDLWHRQNNITVKFAS